MGDPQETDSAAIWLPEGVRVGWGVSEVQEAFVTTLMTMLKRSQALIYYFAALHCRADYLRCLLKRLLGEA